MREIKEVKEIHDILFDALCYFDDFCCKHEITYFLSNGTLLGAAKYGNFVPWDDDIDILMPRTSYDRLMEMDKITNGQYRLLCKQQEATWRMPYAKLSCENTVIEEGNYDFGEKFGVNLDIFPIDHWHPCMAVAKLQSIHTELLKRMLVAVNGGEFVTEKTGMKRFILYVIWFIGKKRGYENINKSFEKIIKKSRKYISENAGCVVWTCHATKEVLSKSVFEKTVYLTLRGRKFPTFGGYERYLDSLYGKWREELPIEQQHSNHTLKAWWKND